MRVLTIPRQGKYRGWCRCLAQLTIILDLCAQAKVVEKGFLRLEIRHFKPNIEHVFMRGIGTSRSMINLPIDKQYIKVGFYKTASQRGAREFSTARTVATADTKLRDARATKKLCALH